MNEYEEDHIIQIKEGVKHFFCESYPQFKVHGLHFVWLFYLGREKLLLSSCEIRGNLDLPKRRDTYKLTFVDPYIKFSFLLNSFLIANYTYASFRACFLSRYCFSQINYFGTLTNIPWFESDTVIHYRLSISFVTAIRNRNQLGVTTVCRAIPSIYTNI